MPGFSIDSVFIDLDCSRCGYVQDVQLIDVRLQRLIFCPACKSQIQLVDVDASMHTSAEQIERSMNALLNAFSQLGGNR